MTEIIRGGVGAAAYGIPRSSGGEKGKTSFPVPSNNSYIDVKVEFPIPTKDIDFATARIERLKQAANNYKDVYAVSDLRFTIYKDPDSGIYVTRFTSLKDGKVSYFPEPEMLTFFDTNDHIGSLVEEIV